jgi:hypothetical protein
LDKKHPLAGEHMPGFVTAPGQTDVLFVITTILLIVAVLGVGILYLRLHALPEQIAHRTRKVQMEIVAVLALLALFTHNHLFWIAGLLLAFIELPDFGTPINSMAKSLSRLAGRDEEQRAAAASGTLPQEIAETKPVAAEAPPPTPVPAVADKPQAPDAGSRS